MSEAATQFQGFTLGISAADSPASYTSIANILDWSFPGKSMTHDITNAADTWQREIPTLLQAGKITFKIQWQMTEVTHKNTASGLRYLWLQKAHRYFQASYNDGSNSADVIPGYVTGFQVTGKVGSTIEATIEISVSGTPTVV